MSPTRFMQRKFRAGGTSGSIFSLIAATLGSGTISFAYAVQQNGIILGIFIILLGASISYYTGMLLVKVSNKTQCNRYEDFAQKLYGKGADRSHQRLIWLVWWVSLRTTLSMSSRCSQSLFFYSERKSLSVHSSYHRSGVKSSGPQYSPS